MPLFFYFGNNSHIIKFSSPCCADASGYRLIISVSMFGCLLPLHRTLPYLLYNLFILGKDLLKLVSLSISLSLMSVHDT